MANEFVNLMKKLEVNRDEKKLLQQQEEFLKSNQQSSVKIIYPKDSAYVQRKGMSVNKVKSQFSSSRQSNIKRDEMGISTLQNNEEMINPINENIEEPSQKKIVDYSKLYNLPKIIPKVILGNIVEKKHPTKDIKKFKHNVPFNKKEETNIMENQLAIDIHNENLEKLSKMSEKEILEEKKILEETLNPSLIEFLRNKNKNKKLGKISIKQDNVVQNNIPVTNEVTMDIKISSNKDIKFEIDTASNLAEVTVNTKISNNKKMKHFLDNNDDIRINSMNNELDIPNSPKNILDESKQRGWLHMDSPEPEKLKWMEDLPEERKDELITNAEYNARFDFNGLLLAYKDENLINRGLYHHGEEPERPGYSLQELLYLSRSSLLQQRCIALTTLANIIEKARKGWYDKILNPAPLIALSQKNVLLLLRFALDDSSVSIVVAALQALKAFLVSEADEICLDRLYEFNGHLQPTLMPQLEEKDISSLKDHELAQLDAVAALLRTDILLRIRYILSEMRPSLVGVRYALEILIRLARHSHTVSLNISSTPGLLDTIIDNFLPMSMDKLAVNEPINNAYGIPLVTAVKLCRILVIYGKKPIAEKLGNFKVIQALLTYINCITNTENNINLAIESLRLWQLLLHYNVAPDSIADIQLTLRSQVQSFLSYYDIQKTCELECEYITTLIMVASQETTLRSEISTLLAKWSTQLSSLSNIRWGTMKLIAMVLSIVNEISVFKTTWLSNQYIFSTLRSNSNLLSSSNLAMEREPSCLPNLAALMETGEIQPILSVNSCIPFLAIIMEIFCKYLCMAEIRSILEHSSFYKYLQNLEKIDWNLERSWYSRMEFRLLIAVIKAASMLGNTINNQIVHIIWKINIKLISALSADNIDHMKELFQIALSKEKINLEIITSYLAKLDLAVDQIKIGLSSDVISLYEKYIIRNDDWNQAAMPKDWFFLPLVNIYTKCRKNIRLQLEDKNSIVTILSLALILPEFIEQLSPNLRFTRLALVYLCDAIYLNEDVSALLSKMISNLIQKHYAELNCNTEVPGLNSFIDLFTALCEEFCANSYGNDNFAMMLLIPLTQRQDVHYRKMLWSEHAVALRYLKLSREKLSIPLKEYLYPEEEDVSLIENYIMALVRGVVKETWCPVPYIIALHHSAMFLKRSNKTAIQLRKQVEKMQDKDIASKLLNYESPQL